MSAIEDLTLAAGEIEKESNTGSARSGEEIEEQIQNVQVDKPSDVEVTPEKGDYKLEKVKIKKTEADRLETNLLANRARNMKVNTSNMTTGSRNNVMKSNSKQGPSQNGSQQIKISAVDNKGTQDK